MIESTDYTGYLGIAPPADLKVLEDIAIGMLIERCPQYPKTPAELALLDTQTQEYLKKALMLQINHLDNNRELLEGVSGDSFSIGKYSESVTTDIYPMSVSSLLGLAGICNLWVTPRSGCRNCG